MGWMSEYAKNRAPENAVKSDPTARPVLKRFSNMQEILPPELVCTCSHSKVCLVHTDFSGNAK